MIQLKELTRSGRIES